MGIFNRINHWKWLVKKGGIEKKMFVGVESGWDPAYNQKITLLKKKCPFVRNSHVIFMDICIVFLTGYNMIFVFATHNAHKVSEVQAMLPASLQIRSLTDMGFKEDIPETADTLQGNALQKAQYVYERCHCDCFADDTGLEVDALQGRPGVYSARYAGEGCSFDDNVRKVLKELENIPLEQRTARFRTVVALIWQGKTYYFEGKVEGLMTLERHGVEGFGYDPIFLPDGYDQTFAEMEAAEKNRISHRGRAIQALVSFLEKNHQNNSL